MLQKVSYLAAAFAAACATASPAAPLAADSQWHAFDIDDLGAVDNGLEWIDLAGQPLHFTFNLATPSVLKVVDAGISGDRFELFDGPLSLGRTSPGSAGAELRNLVWIR